MNIARILVRGASAAQSRSAQQLADSLRLPFLDVAASPKHDDDLAEMHLIVGAERLELRKSSGDALGALYVDFVEGRLDWKRKCVLVTC